MQNEDTARQKLSRRVSEMGFSQTFVMSNRVRALRAEGKEVISLTLGEPDFDVPDSIKLVAKKAIDENFSHYSPVPGFMELRKAVALKLQRDNALSYEPVQICCSTGAKQSIYNALAALLNDGDEVILPAPFWVSYAEMTKMLGGVPVPVATSRQSGFKMSAEQLSNAITPRTKVLLFSSPCNPTGAVYSHKDYESWKEILLANPQVTVIADEIYGLINYEGKTASIASIPELYEQVVTINGMSKAFAMTGWRLGYSAAPKWLAKGIEKIQGQITSGPNTIAQRAAITALQTAPEEFSYMVEAFRQRRDATFPLLQQIPHFQTELPPAAFYFFPDISFYLNKKINGEIISGSDDFAMHLLENCLVGTVGGAAFGDDRCIRISYAASQEQLNDAMHRIREYLTDAIIEDI